MRKVLLLGLVLLFASASAFAQGRVVTGTVTSGEDGMPIPGASVVVKGTTIGTATDLDGQYSLNVPQGSNVLVFSFVGSATQELNIGNRTVINAVLQPDVRNLEEFVITSFGDLNRREITGAISSVKGEVIQDLPMQSFDRAIQGRIAGVQIASGTGQPGGTLNVRIRGVGSVNAGNDPLYIIDGVQVPAGGLSGQGSQNALASINPNDIESIEVLKDAAAGAIYGAQAANGVVLITTKRGSKGATKIRLSVQEGVVQPLGLYDVMDARELAALKRSAIVNAGGSAESAALTYGNPDDPNLFTNSWVDDIFQNARLSIYDLSMSGGDDKTTFFFSGSYTDQGSQLVSSDYQRATGRLNLTHRANQKLTINTNLSLAYQKTNGAIDRGNFVNSPFQAGFTSRPGIPIRNEDGTFRDYPSDHLFGYNIAQGVREELRLSNTIQTVSNIQLNYQFTPWLSFTSFAGVDFSDSRDENSRPSTIAAFRAQGGSALFQDRRNVNFNTNHNFNFNKKFNDVHTVSGILGYEYKTETREFMSANGQGFANPALRYLQNAATPLAVSSNFTQFRRVGFFFQTKYDYNDKYTADFVIRRDGHSRFGNDVQYGTFGAASVGWRLSNEGFLKDVTWLDDLRMRASYGVTGNSEIPNFASLSLAGSAGQYLGTPVLRLTQLGNNLLTWEESESSNIGIDGVFFNGRIIATVDFWRRDSNGLLFNAALPIDSGFGSIFRNSGRMRNQGVDIDIQTVNVVAGKFRWTTAFNVTFLENEVLELFDGNDRIGNTIVVGKPLNPVFAPGFLGVNPANGRPMYQDATGNYTYTIRDADIAESYLGSLLPTSFGGFSNNFSYGPLSLEIFFQYQFGNLAQNSDLINLGSTGSGPNNQLRDQANYWRQPGDMVSNPKPWEGGNRPGGSGYTQWFTSRQIMDGSYIRLKTLTLGYELPSNLIRKIGVNQGRAFVQGVNLATFTNFVGIDPEVAGVNVGNSFFAAFPNAMQISGGINLTF
ncbi:SusC/RagA family TonB-linked outer membrane protein [Mongoliitalea lutea]|uniref:SusC/RagA family TonB-linked outer membrane protein n=1 Tax=Mongoliitalea lutea TaxID=849756 RepID=A0A8J3CXQ7_9BACT|nr:TonB-dependent receptor [Mongoliitalea lutea]GHB35302.1 SusC/RagA family TonB-linked outer membrane protein [Mongoliitalea lutea]